MSPLNMTTEGSEKGQCRPKPFLVSMSDPNDEPLAQSMYVREEGTAGVQQRVGASDGDSDLWVSGTAGGQEGPGDSNDWSAAMPQDAKADGILASHFRNVDNAYVTYLSPDQIGIGWAISDGSTADWQGRNLAEGDTVWVKDPRFGLTREHVAIVVEEPIVYVRWHNEPSMEPFTVPHRNLTNVTDVTNTPCPTKCSPNRTARARTGS